MRFNNLSVFVIPALSLVLASEVGAAQVDLGVKNPLVTEIVTLDTKPSSYPMIVSFLMGVWGYDAGKNAAVHQVLPEEIQHKLYLACKAATNVVTPFTTWPDKCTPGVLADLMYTHFGQHWLVPDYLASKREKALKDQIAAIRVYKSPLVIPLYGHADHWGTVYKMKVEDANWAIVYKVYYFDGGSPGPMPDDPAEDSYGKEYTDIPQTIETGDSYKDTYYKILPGTDDDILGPDEPLVGRYVFAYDPPIGSRPLPTDPRPVTWARGLPLVAAGEMTEALASVLVWDALEAEELLTERSFGRLVDATPGDAWTVHGKHADGAAHDYIVVPMYDESMRGVVALVGLSAADGSFERMRYLGRPQALDLPDQREAATRARRLLAAGEVLVDDGMTWDPACGGAHCRQPLLPYHSFTVRSQRGGVAGRITVPMGGHAPLRR